MLAVKIKRRDEFDSLRFCEFFGTGADQHDVWRFLHYEAREMDWIRDVLERSDGARSESTAVHDSGVHFRNAGARVVGAAARVKKTGIFHGANCGLDCIEARPAGGKDCIALLDGDNHGGAPWLDGPGRRFTVVARAAMCDEHETGSRWRSGDADATCKKQRGKSGEERKPSETGEFHGGLRCIWFE